MYRHSQDIRTHTVEFAMLVVRLPLFAKASSIMLVAGDRAAQCFRISHRLRRMPGNSLCPAALDANSVSEFCRQSRLPAEVVFIFCCKLSKTSLRLCIIVVFSFVRLTLQMRGLASTIRCTPWQSRQGTGSLLARQSITRMQCNSCWIC